MALARGDYRGTVAASDAGIEAAPDQGTAVQLAAQKARAYAQMSDSQRAREALEDGRARLERLPYPDNLDHHFKIDPAKFDFYALHTHRMLGEDRIASMYANEVIESSTRDGQNHHPMRVDVALITLGVAAAHDGAIDEAVAYGTKALEGDRKSIPSLIMTSSDLANALREHRSDPDVDDYLRRIRALARHDTPQRG
jgi:tetratricopeptide (TPR) repeat protein